MTKKIVDGDEAPEPLDESWPPSFPHSAIDELFLQLKTDGSVDVAEELLQHIAREAQRLRSTVARLSVERLSAAEREAHAIVSEAHASAATVRETALQAVESRLDEADHLTAAMRRFLAVETRSPELRPYAHDAEADASGDE